MGKKGQRRVEHYYSKIVGVTYRNSDGSDRQKLIRKCSTLETLILDHEENNPADRNAVRVCRRNGEQLGYLNAKRAEEVVTKSKQGYRFVVFVKEITGDRDEGESNGVNILILQTDPGVGNGEATKYLQKLIKEDPQLEGATITTGASCFLKFLILVVLGGAATYILMGRK